MSEQIKNAVQQVLRGDIKLYACGGAGINVGSAFEHFRDFSEPGMALIDTVYLDASRSNLKPTLPESSIYILPEVDGSGKERRQNSAAILKSVKEMLQKHRPGYVNVVLSSASGGSGAVLAAVLAKELMDKDEIVIVITIGVADSGIEIKNTLDTLKSFEGIVNATKRSLPVAYFENTKETPPSAVDSDINDLVVGLAVMFSRQNEGLDTRDLYNFVNVDKLTSHKPQVAGLKSYSGVLKAEEHTDTITVASAVTNKDNRGIDFVIPYTCYGILPAEVTKDVSERAPIHLVTKAYPFNGIAKRLKLLLDEMEQAALASTAASEVLDANDNLEGGFLVL